MKLQKEHCDWIGKMFWTHSLMEQNQDIFQTCGIVKSASFLGQGGKHIFETTVQPLPAV